MKTAVQIRILQSRYLSEHTTRFFSFSFYFCSFSFFDYQLETRTGLLKHLGTISKWFIVNGWIVC